MAASCGFVALYQPQTPPGRPPFRLCDGKLFNTAELRPCSFKFLARMASGQVSCFLDDFAVAGGVKSLLAFLQKDAITAHPAFASATSC